MGNIQKILRGETPMRELTSVVGGIMLGENRKGFFSVVESVPTTTNYIRNCAFMVGRYPYNSIGTSTPRTIDFWYTLVNSNISGATSDAPECYPMHGGWAKINPNSGATAGIYQQNYPLLPGQYTFSCFVAGKKSHEFEVYAATSSGVPISAKKTMRGNDNWQRLHITFEVTVEGAYRLYLVRKQTTVDPTRGFYTSFWVCEDNAFLTLPFNGDMKEVNPTSKNEYEWTENYAEWYGRSSRSGRAVGSGRERFLKDYNFILTEILGLGSSGVNHVLEKLSSSGSVWNATKVESREFSLKGQIYAATLEERMKVEADLEELLSSTSKINPEQPLTMLFRVFNDSDNSIVEGQTLYIYCRYNGGISQAVINENGAYNMTLSFTLVDPYLYSSMHKDADFTTVKREINAGLKMSIALRNDKKNGWEHAPFSVGPGISEYNLVKTMVRGKDGLLYIGGNFLEIDGAASPYFGSFNESTEEFTPIGTFAPYTNEAEPVCSVNALYPLSNGDILVGGTFLSVNAVERTALFARYRPATGLWSRVGWLPAAAFSTVNLTPSVNTIDVDQSGNIYIAGAFDDRMAFLKFNGTSWGTYGEGGVITETQELVGGTKFGVTKLITRRKPIYPLSQADDVYICGGRIGSIAGVTVNNIALYSNGAWHSLGGIGTNANGRGDGSVNDMLFGNDGKLYVFGNFLQNADGSVQSKWVMRHNGNQFEPVLLPGDMDSYIENIKTAAIDAEGKIHILCTITQKNPADDETFGVSGTTIDVPSYLSLDGNTFSPEPLLTTFARDPLNYQLIHEGLLLYYDQQKRSMWLFQKFYTEHPMDSTRMVTYNYSDEFENRGERVYPNIKFFGAGRISGVENQTTQKRLNFTHYEILSNETLELDLESFGKNIIQLISDRKGNVTGALSPSSNIDFDLANGKNRLGILMINIGNDALARLRWREKYISLSHAIRYRNIL